jgi:hypothetical protein
MIVESSNGKGRDGGDTTDLDDGGGGYGDIDESTSSHRTIGRTVDDAMVIDLSAD